MYEENQKKEPGNVDIMISRMRCLRHLGQWEQMIELAQDARERDMNPSQASTVAAFSLQAALNLGTFDVCPPTLPVSFCAPESHVLSYRSASTPVSCLPCRSDLHVRLRSFLRLRTTRSSFGSPR